MRSSKSRSRSKSNRNRSVGNIVNRVFDSSGPEGKVRGTPQQIIDKYNQLARDAQLGNDRVATENFQQHAEHYTRMLGEALREQEARREQQEAQNRERQQQQQDRQQQQQQDRQNQQPAAQPDPSEAPQPDTGADVIDLSGGDAESGLVETPEATPPAPEKKPARQRAPRRKPKPAEAEAEAADQGDSGGAAAAE